MSPDKRYDRRQFLRIAGSAATVPVALWAINNRVHAQSEGKKLSLDDPQAKALGYVHDTNEVDSSKYPRHEPSQKCKNCQLAQSAEGEWIPCQLFPGKLVNADGWCASYVAKT